jgi:hypothetical protein
VPLYGQKEGTEAERPTTHPLRAIMDSLSVSDRQSVTSLSSATRGAALGRWLPSHDVSITTDPPCHKRLSSPLLIVQFTPFAGRPFFSRTTAVGQSAFPGPISGLRGSYTLSKRTDTPLCWLSGYPARSGSCDSSPIIPPARVAMQALKPAGNILSQ